MTSLIEQAKQKAAYQAVDEHVLPSHKVIGVGSGSTVVHVVARLLQRDPELNARTVFIPTSFQSRGLLLDGGLNVGDVEQYPNIDVTIDGADEVDSQLNAIKGGGGAHLQEKVVAEAASKFVIVADFRKDSKILGEQWIKGVPVEVVPFAWRAVLKKLQGLGSKEAMLRMAVAKAGPVVTDNGNFLIDAPFGLIRDPAKLLTDIKLITGVVEVGLFCNMAQVAYFGCEDGSVTIRTK
ncbi:ribose-5-phosphate isomerase [Lobosporangium transversale]|uniref:Ribose-5-phosphate isomerase n=1 Tax=Lobosporangium transversale TaxID=64571 RepID=A0A1Y2G8B8_9FUNG|nr:ribose-5-phosphate isomerase [Lobosporangium transversale]ORZ04083.1 ribose-5-phosphate isomerase [Lobosporangium transversale]|eukprot:XP_021876360.1 ribose-5-phosphate isomerase [Lobosporangium transversale]